MRHLTSYKQPLTLAKAFLAGNNIFKINNRNTRTRCEICSKLTIETPERCFSTSIATFEQVNAGWLAESKVYAKSFFII